MEDKSEWEQFLIANIPTITITSSLQKKGENNFPAVKDLNREKKDFAFKLEEVFKGLPEQRVILEDISVEEDEEIDLLAREDSKGCAAMLKEALKNVAHISDRSSVQEFDGETTKILLGVGENSVNRFEKEITEALKDNFEDPITRVDKENTEVFAEPSDAIVTIVNKGVQSNQINGLHFKHTDKEVPEVPEECGDHSLIKKLPSATDQKRYLGMKARLGRCGKCPGCLHQDCKTCR